MGPWQVEGPAAAAKSQKAARGFRAAGDAQALRHPRNPAEAALVLLAVGNSALCCEGKTSREASAGNSGELGPDGGESAETAEGCMACARCAVRVTCAPEAET